MKILFFGDIFGKPGRKALLAHLPKLLKQYEPNFVIANAENASHGKGLTKKHFLALKNSGINCLTMGNHTWDKQEIFNFINENEIVRPYNIPNDYFQGNCGFGTRVYQVADKKIRVTNLLGRSVTMKFEILNPFEVMENILNLEEKADLHLVDFHAETTSEKNAFRYCFDGMVSAIFGTHTHVPTFDGHITGKNTFYITDVGMCGPGYESVIGATPECTLVNFKGNGSEKFHLRVCEIGFQINGIFLIFDKLTNLPTYFQQIKIVG